MTDNEIIKALEFCAMRGKREVCGKCPYYNTVCCEEQLLVDSVLLINRQKAEIERLNNSAKQWEDTAKDLFIGKQTAKAEAIKEFAERLKAEMLKSKYNLTVSPYSRACNAVIVFWVEEIDNLVKEMVGDGGEDHLIAAIWNLCGLAWTEEKKPEMMDIPARKDGGTDNGNIL